MQVQAAAQEYQREFAAKDATITALSAEVESLQDLLHNQLHDARDAAQVCFSQYVFPIREAVPQRYSSAHGHGKCPGTSNACSELWA